MDIKDIWTKAKKAKELTDIFPWEVTQIHNSEDKYVSFFVADDADHWPVRIELDRGGTRLPVVLDHIAAASPDNVIQLIEDLTTAVKYLREGKAKFAPNTDNSFVDDFIKKHENL